MAQWLGNFIHENVGTGIVFDHGIASLRNWFAMTKKRPSRAALFCLH
jgi:hypothetical protein